MWLRGGEVAPTSGPRARQIGELRIEQGQLIGPDYSKKEVLGFSMGRQPTNNNGCCNERSYL
jgi:hypothetical protein